jgi:hypothetical protein
LTSPFDDGTVVTMRHSILEEERLQRAVTRDEELRRTRPDAWRSREAERRAENKEIAATNRRLRAAGLEPLRLRPTLAQRRQELQRLRQQNVAEIAAFKAKSANSGPKPRGTRLARRRSRRVDD